MSRYKTLMHFLLLFISVSLLAIQFATASESPQKTLMPLPPLTKVISSQSHTPEKNWQKQTIEVKPNGSLSEVLNEVGIDPRTTYQITQTPNSQWLTRLAAGDALEIWLDSDNQLKKILYPKTEQTHYQLTSDGEGFKIEQLQHPIETKIVTASGLIQHSFYLSGEAQGLSAKTIMNLADIFSWEIDFIRQLRPGDPFKVIYEKRYIQGEYIGDGDILAAEITTGGDERHTAFLLKDAKGQSVGYYDHNKQNLRKAFLRNPVDYVRITSRYKPKRFHPVLKKWRAHRGVDYGGPTGTPIRATGDGQIIKRYWSRSYGRVIYIRHADKYTTVYAHMSKFGHFKRGQWVKQGQVIGYIGQTGMASGPHLHYEFRKNGRYIDPLRVKFPDASPVPRKHRNRFDQFSGLMSAQLSRLDPHTQIAANFE